MLPVNNFLVNIKKFLIGYDCASFTVLYLSRLAKIRTMKGFSLFFFFFVLAEPSNKQKYLLVVFKSRLFHFLYLIVFFCFIVVVKHLPKHGQLGVVYATSSPLLWDQEKAGKTSELCKDYQVYGVKVICLV